MKALLEEKVGSWHKQPSEPDQVPAVPNTPIPQFAPGADTVYLVDLTLLHHCQNARQLS